MFALLGQLQEKLTPFPYFNPGAARADAIVIARYRAELGRLFTSGR